GCAAYPAAHAAYDAAIACCAGSRRARFDVTGWLQLIGIHCGRSLVRCERLNRDLQRHLVAVLQDRAVKLYCQRGIRISLGTRARTRHMSYELRALRDDYFAVRLHGIGRL